MKYVQRDSTGKIICIYANPQPQSDGTSLTDQNPLPEDNLEIITFLSTLPNLSKLSSDPVITKSELQSVLTATGLSTVQVTTGMAVV